MIYTFCISLKRSQKRAILLGIDAASVVAAFLLSWTIALGKIPTPEMIVAAPGLRLLAVTLVVGMGLTVSFGLHRVKLNAYQIQSVFQTGIVAVAIGFAGAIGNLLPGARLPMQVFVVLPMAFAILSVGIRLSLRSFLLWVYRKGHVRKRVLIYGAGQTGQQLVAALGTDNDVEPVAFVDDNPSLHNLTIAGLRVHPPVRTQELVIQKEIDQVVLAMPSASRPTRARIAERMRKIGCEVLAVPSFAELVARGELPRALEPVDVSELLGRDHLEPDLPGVSDAYQGRRILVTGAGGSIGTELCRQLLSCKPKSLVLLDHSELAIYNIQRELADTGTDCLIVPVLGTISEPALVARALEQHEIDVVLHTAAYKHLPLVEHNCLEGLRNNVLGTKNVAEAAGKAGVERFILVSSDKAVRPTSVMGSSKRLAELVVQDLSTRASKTRFSMVRFGNVLGSSGSVIPLFEEQIARGGPVTLTHPDVTRYFMTVSEAVRLVLLAGTFARGGDVFVLDMGEAIPIDLLARQVITSAGYTVRDADTPNGEIEIQVTGLRTGEKMHEELLIGSDMLTTPHPKILRAQEGHLSELEMATVLQDLRRAIDGGDESAARKVLERWVEPHSEAVELVSIIND